MQTFNSTQLLRTHAACVGFAVAAKRVEPLRSSALENSETDGSDDEVKDWDKPTVHSDEVLDFGPDYCEDSADLEDPDDLLNHGQTTSATASSVASSLKTCN